jgi:hypothetical protein
MKQITLEYYGMTGTGSTLKEAKADAGAKIAKAMNAEYTPYQMCLGDVIGILYRTPAGYCTSVKAGKHTGDVYGTMHGDCTRGEAMLSMRRHMADVAGIDAEQAAAWFYKDPIGLSYWKDKQAFQLAYKHGKAQGIPDADIHTYACEHTRDFLIAV